MQRIPVLKSRLPVPVKRSAIAADPVTDIVMVPNLPSPETSRCRPIPLEHSRRRSRSVGSLNPCMKTVTTTTRCPEETTVTVNASVASKATIPNSSKSGIPTLRPRPLRRSISLSSGLALRKKSGGLHCMHILQFENDLDLTRVPKDVLKKIGRCLNEFGYLHPRIHGHNFHSIYNELTTREFLNICVVVASTFCDWGYGNTEGEIAKNLVELGAILQYEHILAKSVFLSPMAPAQRVQTSNFLLWLCQKALEVKNIALEEQQKCGTASGSDNSTLNTKRAAAAIFVEACNNEIKRSDIDEAAVTKRYHAELRAAQFAQFRESDLYEKETAEMQKAAAKIKKDIADKQRQMQEADDRVDLLRQTLAMEEESLRKRKAELGLDEDANLEEENKKLRQEILDIENNIRAAKLAKRGCANPREMQQQIDRQEDDQGKQIEVSRGEIVSPKTWSVDFQNDDAWVTLSDQLHSRWLTFSSQTVPKLNDILRAFSMAPVRLRKGHVPLTPAELMKTLEIIEVAVFDANKAVEDRSGSGECNLSQCESYTPSDSTGLEEINQFEHEKEQKEALELLDFEINELLIQQEEEIAKLEEIRKTKRTDSDHPTGKRGGTRRLFSDNSD